MGKESAAKRNIKNIPRYRVKVNKLLLSFSESSLFCITAVPIPILAIKLKKLENTVRIATIPKSFGVSILARTAL
jgi:hypothetical protein